jgi:hypothetical protein
MLGDHQVTAFARDLPDLSALGVISPEFQHVEKLVTVGDDLSLPTAYLKWYDIRRYGVDMPPALIAESRAFLRAEVAAHALNLNQQLGFVELHHCASVAFLLVFTWNNENELWETAYIKDLDGAGPFQQFVVRDGLHRPMNCVWELAPLWHERQAWVRYLRSPRDDAAKRAYLADRYVGAC